MKSRKSLTGGGGVILVSILVFVIFLIGCEVEPEEPVVYTVWTGAFNFSSTDSVFGTMTDGFYRKKEITNSEFEWEIENNFKNSSQFEWTEEQLFSYLIGWGFSETNAEEETAWLVSVSHGYIGTRSGSTLYMIIK
jgi:hypothetical protein